MELGLQPLSATVVWSQYVEKSLPGQLQPDILPQYRKMADCLKDYCVQTSAPVAPNGNLSLCQARSLYDHRIELFTAAFRHPQQSALKFIHPQLQYLTDYWIKLGLHTRRQSDAIMDNDYLECVKAIETRLSQPHNDQNLRADLEVVAGYLTYDKQCFKSWQKHCWEHISRVPMFTVQQAFPGDRAYRQDRVRAIALRSTHCSLQQSGKRVLRRILWSQVPFLHNPPADYVYSQIPLCNKADTSDVYKNLLYLMEVLSKVQARDIVEFLRDVQACYGALQDNLAQTTPITGIRQAKIWLNLDTTEIDTVTSDQLLASVTMAERLCINAVAEPPGYKNTRKFLTPYEKLLKALGIQAVVTRDVPMHNDGGQRETPSDYIARCHRELRDQRTLVDVTFTAEGQSKAAHKVILAGVSDYCKTQFSGHWGRLLAQSDAPIPLEIKYQTLSRIVDFAYDGTVTWQSLPAEPTDDQIADRLDELLDLLQASDMWLMPQLHIITETHLLQNFKLFVRIDNVEPVLERAKEARAFTLVDECTFFRDQNRKFVDMYKDENTDVNGEGGLYQV